MVFVWVVGIESEERKEEEKETGEKLRWTRLRRLWKKAKSVELHQGSCLC
jgi:hypothetical protein